MEPRRKNSLKLPVIFLHGRETRGHDGKRKSSAQTNSLIRLLRGSVVRGTPELEAAGMAFQTYTCLLTALQISASQGKPRSGRMALVNTIQDSERKKAQPSKSINATRQRHKSLEIISTRLHGNRNYTSTRTKQSSPIGALTKSKVHPKFSIK